MNSKRRKSEGENITLGASGNSTSRTLPLKNCPFDYHKAFVIVEWITSQKLSYSVSKPNVQV